MDWRILWRALLVQVVAVMVLSLVLALLLPRSFFESWGWLSGPAAWLLCARLSAEIVGLPPGPTLIRAILAGLPSVLFVVLGLHWLGALFAAGMFAALCARLPRPLAAGRA